MTISLSTDTPAITLDQWLERAETWKKATKELVILWFDNNLGTQKQLADHLCITPQAISKQKAKLITSGELNAVMDKSKTPKAHVKKVDIPVENSNQEIEQVKVIVEDQPSPQPSAPSITSAGSSVPKSKADDPVLEGWNGSFNELAEKIYKREKPSSKKRVVIAEQMAEFKTQLERTMKAASNNHREKAGRLLEVDVKIVEAVLEKEGRPGIEETLKQVMYEAERIRIYASESLRILQLDKDEA